MVLLPVLHILTLQFKQESTGPNTSWKVVTHCSGKSNQLSEVSSSNTVRWDTKVERKSLFLLSGYRARFTLVSLKFLPSQILPSPAYPSLHVHVKLPSVLAQVACGWHWFSSLLAHSTISEHGGAVYMHVSKAEHLSLSSVQTSSYKHNFDLQCTFSLASFPGPLLKRIICTTFDPCGLGSKVVYQHRVQRRVWGWGYVFDMWNTKRWLNEYLV